MEAGTQIWGVWTMWKIHMSCKQGKPYLVPVCDTRDLGWQGEDHVEILHGKKILGSRCHPVARGWPLALRAVPVLTGIISDMAVVTLGTCRHMPAERFGSAGFDRRHHFELRQADMSLVGPPPRGTVLLENVSNLQLGAGHYPGRATPTLA